MRRLCILTLVCAFALSFLIGCGFYTVQNGNQNGFSGQANNNTQNNSQNATQNNKVDSDEAEPEEEDPIDEPEAEEPEEEDPIDEPEAEEPEEEDPIDTPEEDVILSKPTFTKQEYGDLGFWLYTPSETTESKPLIVYLHGGSGNGSDLDLITSVDGFPKYLSDGEISPDAYVVIPQLSEDKTGWVSVKDEIAALIGFMISDHSVDESRVALTGHSMGGTGAWQIALAYPEMFSAVAPLSGSIKLSDRSLKKLKEIAVWAIVGDADRIVPPDSSIEFIEELEKINEDARLTVLSGCDHFNVPRVYLDSELDVIGWLIAGRKNITD